MTNSIALEIFYKSLMWIGILHCDYHAIGSVDDRWHDISDTVLSIRNNDISSSRISAWHISCPGLSEKSSNTFCTYVRSEKCLNVYRHSMWTSLIVLRDAWSYLNSGSASLQWRHNGRDGVSNQQPHHCLLNRLFRHRSKKTSKLCVTGLCSGNSPVTGEFPAQMASNAENASVWWHHYDTHHSDYQRLPHIPHVVQTCKIQQYACLKNNHRLKLGHHVSIT